MGGACTHPTNILFFTGFGGVLSLFRVYNYWRISVFPKTMVGVLEFLTVQQDCCCMLQRVGSSDTQFGISVELYASLFQRVG